MKRTVQRFGLGIGAALIATGLAAAVFASPQDTNAAPGGFAGGPGGRHMAGPMGAAMGGPMAPFAGFRMLAQRLGLSDAQKAQLKTIADAHRSDWKALADRATQAHQALRTAIEADTPDDATIRDRSAAVAAVQADIAVAAAHARAEMWQVLTPDQQAQAKQLESQMQQRMQERMQRFRDRTNQPQGQK